MPTGNAPASGGGALQFKAPPDWTAKPVASSMRRAQFVLPGKGAGDAELVVFHFPGMGGSVDDNVTRWHAQFKAEPGGPGPTTKTSTINGLKVTTTRITGTFAKPRDPMGMGGATDDVPKQALWGAIVETPGGPW